MGRFCKTGFIKIRLIMVLIIIVIFSQISFADDNDNNDNGNDDYIEPAPVTKSANSGSAYFEFGLGGSSLNQEIVSNHSVFGFGFLAAVGYHLGSKDRNSPQYHLGFAYFLQGFQSKRGANVNETLSSEQFQLIALRLGFTPFRWFRFDVGYGLALFSHNEDLPNAITSNTTSRHYNATGTGWFMGGAIMPFTSGPVRIGFVGFYYDATAPSYTSDITTGGAHQVSEIKSGVHTTGLYTGLAMFLGL